MLNLAEYQRFSLDDENPTLTGFSLVEAVLCDKQRWEEEETPHSS